VARHIFIASAGPLKAYTLSTVNGSPHYVTHVIKLSAKRHLAKVRALLKTYHLALTFNHYTLSAYSAASFRTQALHRRMVYQVSPTVIKVSTGRYLHILLLASWVPMGAIRLTDLLYNRSRRKYSRIFPIHLAISVLVQLLNLCEYLHSCEPWQDVPWQVFLDCLTPASVWLAPNGYIKLVPSFHQLISGQCSAPKPRRDGAHGLRVLLHRVGTLCLELLNVNRKIVLKFPTVSEFYATVCCLRSLVIHEIAKSARSSRLQLVHYYTDASQIDCFFDLLRVLSNPFAVPRIDATASYNTVRAVLQPILYMQLGILEVDGRGVTRYMRALEAHDLAQARLLLHNEGLHRDHKHMTAFHRLALSNSLLASSSYWFDLVCSLDLDTLNAVDGDNQYALRYLWLNGYVSMQILLDASRLSSSAIYLSDISASTINQIIYYGTHRCSLTTQPNTAFCLPTSKQAYTPLMYAALNGLEYAVAGLVDQYARITTDDGITAGTFAMQRGYRAVADYLAKYEVVRMPSGLTMLQSMLAEAASEEDPKTLIQLANDAHQLLHMTSFHASSTGDTALIIASRYGLLTKAHLLGAESLKSLYGHLLSAEAGLINNEHHTSLMCVCQSGRALQSECKALIKAGEAGMSTHTGVTALMYASQAGCLELIRLLLPYEGGRCSVAGESALELSAFALNKEAVSLIMKYEGPEHAASVVSLLIAACGRGQFSRTNLVKVQAIVMLLSRPTPRGAAK
ncbi:Ankyrin repeat protein, partial [Giardia duodenalis]